MLEHVRAADAGLLKKFPDGNEPYQIMTRLLEKAGELAQQVNLFENSGVKREKYGEPDRAALADEVKGGLVVLCQLVDYYRLDPELESALATTIANLRRDGFLPT